MKLNTTHEHLKRDPAAENLFEFLQANEIALGLTDAQFYYDFPVFKDWDGTVLISDVLILSRNHGIVAFGVSNATPRQNIEVELRQVEQRNDKVFSFLYSRLIRNTELKKSRVELSFPAELILYTPFIEKSPESISIGMDIICTHKNLGDYLENTRIKPSLSDVVFMELISTIEGAKGLMLPKTRDLKLDDPNSKGQIVSRLESKIASFDQNQKHGYMSILDGLQRIRGLAGSGKTVVLAMKAALTHLKNPDATVLYTFYTRSLYQHIQRMITRFYRQFDDRNPDWDKLKIMHAWGGYNQEGVYYNACLHHDVRPLSYSEANRNTNGDAFDFACRDLLNKVDIEPMYDFLLIDEGQDFPNSFVKLCVKLTKQTRVVYAYDELQTIFQIKAPSPAEILGPDAELSNDIVLFKCYRNPREILVCAHALGFGIYGSSIVQMLENKEHWEDIGYQVVEGDFVEGSEIVIQRPADNSLAIISEAQDKNEIVQAFAYDDFSDEINIVAESIKSDLEDGLRPDDILVIVVDDRNAKTYLNHISAILASFDIMTNNIHVDNYGIRDFRQDGRVTLSTVHKAKGNEAFMVYVVGVDALFAAGASVRERNILFTAMTRAKGWVRVSGIGEAAEVCRDEVENALDHFPYLQFEYPSPEQLKIMRRDLAEKAIRKQRAERALNRALRELSPEEIKRFIDQRSIIKGDKD
jgi:superfamily I DNA and RNA helicase